MKFCYLDESGTGSEPYAVMVGIIVDAQRMHVTKRNWEALLKVLSKYTKREVHEIHTRDFYRGNGIWRNINGQIRSDITTIIFEWLNKRKHKVIWSVIDKSKYENLKRRDELPSGVNTIWKCLGLHLILSLQKEFQTDKNNKGNTLLIFDEEKREEAEFAKLISNPPE